jgi:hypothetical protein
MRNKGMGTSVAACLQILFFLATGTGAGADVSPGDVVDETNWQKAEGLVPESVLNWVQKGDFVLPVGVLNYDPDQYWPEVAAQSLERNRGKYRVSEEGLMVEAATGKTPGHITGIPFPDVDPNDPQAGLKLMYHRMCYGYCIGSNEYPMKAIWVGRGGHEREVEGAFLSYPMIGWQEASKANNSDLKEKFTIVQILAPYDIRGTNILTYRYLDDRQDMSYGFIPAIRRVRRMTPANRSDAFIGTDMCVDDGYGFDGKINSVNWVSVKRRPALVPWLDENPQTIVQNKKGEWLSTPAIKPVKYGHQQEGWQGAPWAPTNLPWVERDVLVLEFEPKDPYYNYGPQELWIDAEVPFVVYFKIIRDRAGAYWKTIAFALSGLESQDRKMRFLQGSMYVTVDDRSDHATILSGLSPVSISTYCIDMDLNMFSLAGFQRLCK